ncbi:MAG: urea ABC transporter permease subunit UrtB [Rhodospirillales bacterium 20-64-7]|nr:MAG: urea ABC transporter permease subunit UrtB [Rhodospirillales bacterium 20-64-7]
MMLRCLPLCVLAALLAVVPACAAAPERAAMLAELCGESGQDVLHGLRAIAAAAPQDAAWGLRVVEAFSAKRLRCAADGGSFLALPEGTLDAGTLAPVQVDETGLRAPLPSLRARVVLEQSGAALRLFAAARPQTRLAAVATLAKHADTLPPGLVDAALKVERNPGVAKALRALAVESGLHAPDAERRVAAISALASDATSATVTELATLRGDAAYAADPRVASALDGALAKARWQVRIGAVLSLLYNGISAGSVLFMSSVGLAIIFGLMGVINLAQGELIMIGAYTTFCVQSLLRELAPGWIDWYPMLAVPVVFVVTALVGIAIEVLVIRHLYRRPLMTLLATWSISLLLTNLVRVIFGTQNLQFLTPSYLTGGVRLTGDFLVTWNHLFAICAAAVAFGATFALLRLTDLGLFIRAVTQNRAMAGCVGISTRRIDMMAFGFGAGLAGLGGLALSPIYNVNPTMGSGFIIDSFMVVVLGGVGSLAGTALASLGVGLVDVGIEPFYGAVAAKVIALLMIILLIQWRPEGLVAARGRR